MQVKDETVRAIMWLHLREIMYSAPSDPSEEPWQHSTRLMLIFIFKFRLQKAFVSYFIQEWFFKIS